MQVINRANELEEFDVTKIKRAIALGVRDQNVNALELESSFVGAFVDQTETRKIQLQLIDSALRLSSTTYPHWLRVASNLLVNHYNADLARKRGCDSPYEKSLQVIADKIATGVYDLRLKDGYSLEQLKAVCDQIAPVYDYLYDYAGMELLLKRYLMPNEALQEAFIVIALTLALVEKDSLRVSKAIDFYQAIATKEISLATPILANLRKPTPSVSSCFIAVAEDSIDGIFDTVKRVALVSKQGGGVAVCVSKIRARGSWVMGRPHASGGVVPWIKIFNDTAIAVNQGGVREGAATIALDIWHLDTLEFLEIQKEHGDLRQKSFDIFPQLVVSDLFMERVKNDGTWIFVDPYEVEQEFGYKLPELWGEEFTTAYFDIEDNLNKLSLYKTIKARDLVKKIMQTQIETGMPYLAFKDTINRANPNQHVGYIPCVNLCTESFSNVDFATIHCCNLVSINLATIAKNTHNIWDSLKRPCSLAVEILDNSISLNRLKGIPHAEEHNSRYRTIGVGIMGLADWFAYKQLPYGDTKSLNELGEAFSYHCLNASVKLAEERGAYPYWMGSQWWQNGGVKVIPALQNLDNLGYPALWEDLMNRLEVFGIRNSHVMAIAPNSSTSLIQGCTASYLPPFSKYFVNKGNTLSAIAPPYLEERFWYYRDIQSIHPQTIVDVTSTLQKWIDTGISMELAFNLNPGAYSDSDDDTTVLSAFDIYQVILKAWEQGCKSIYYIRSIQEKIDSFQDAPCVACAN